jgi:hypothetical protein
LPVRRSQIDKQLSRFAARLGERVFTVVKLKRDDLLRKSKMGYRECGRRDEERSQDVPPRRHRGVC